MVSRTHGVASASKALTGHLQYYAVWCESPNAFFNPDYASGLNIRRTGNIMNETQKNFELLVQSISLRTMPIILNDPIALPNVVNDGATQISGEGFVWLFSVAMEDAFVTKDSNVGLLVAELDGIVLLNGAVICTSGPEQNIEFERRDT